MVYRDWSFSNISENMKSFQQLKKANIPAVKIIGFDIGNIMVKRVLEIQEWLNSYPRKILNGESANEVIQEEKRST